MLCSLVDNMPYVVAEAAVRSLSLTSQPCSVGKESGMTGKGLI